MQQPGPRSPGDTAPALLAPSARDAFVFRRVAARRFAHVGGVGRGEVWAGMIELDAHHDPVAELLREGEPVVARVDAERVHRFGPYWSRSVVVVRTGADEVVVFGDDDLDVDDPGWSLAGRDLAADVIAVSPAKRLADEIELLHAVRDVALTPPGGLDEVAWAIVTTMAGALSCDVVALRLRSTGAIFIHAGRGSVPLAAPLDVAVSALVEQRRHLAGEPWVEQDAAGHRALEGAVPDARSFVLSRVGDLGEMLAVHRGEDRRGFTQVCRSIAAQGSTAAETVLLAALQRSRMEAAALEARREARRDPLTGLPNRRAWDERLRALVRSGHGATLVVCDVDGLKHVNDTEGHAVGDELLRVAAVRLARAVRHSDLVARLGGDEFGLVLDEAADVDELVARLAAEPGRPRFSIGHARVDPGDDPAVAIARADERMYAVKRARTVGPAAAHPDRQPSAAESSATGSA